MSEEKGPAARIGRHHERFRQRIQLRTLSLRGAARGREPEFGTFRTAPRGRAPFTFTSFGDQGTPTLGKKYVPPAGRDDCRIRPS
jgi:hypothetical protein